MRLIVGPLPAAVYWRRRAVVAVGIAIIVMIIGYACGGPDSVAGAGAASSSSAGPTSTTAVHRPTVPPTSSAPPPSPKPSAFVLPTAVVTGPCSDGELDLVAKAASDHSVTGQPLEVTIEIRNVSGRTCSRDIGADVQELRLQDGDIVIWSSDDCNANSGRDVRSFAKGAKVSFTLRWNGKRSRTGTGARTCVPTAPAPGPAKYQLIARLDGKLSAPFALSLRSG